MSIQVKVSSSCLQSHWWFCNFRWTQFIRRRFQVDSCRLSVCVGWLSALHRAPREKQNKRWGRTSSITLSFPWKHLKKGREVWESSYPCTHIVPLSSEPSQDHPFLDVWFLSSFQVLAHAVTHKTGSPCTLQKSKHENPWSAFNSCSNSLWSMQFPPEVSSRWQVLIAPLNRRWSTGWLGADQAADRVWSRGCVGADSPLSRWNYCLGVQTLGEGGTKW